MDSSLKESVSLSILLISRSYFILASSIAFMLSLASFSPFDSPQAIKINGINKINRFILYGFKFLIPQI